jgi:hypothetical protein
MEGATSVCLIWEKLGGTWWEIEFGVMFWSFGLEFGFDFFGQPECATQ